MNFGFVFTDETAFCYNVVTDVILDYVCNCLYCKLLLRNKDFKTYK